MLRLLQVPQIDGYPMNDLPSGVSCPLPLSVYPRVTLAHGGGGSLTDELVESVFVTVFKDPLLDARHDGAVLSGLSSRIAISTDSHVVRPLFFPGGDIGKLAVCGTVNDLAMCGARPEFLSLGVILEEGFAIDTLYQIALSIKAAADQAKVRIVTGDTKVVERGKGDGIYLNTTGVGSVIFEDPVCPQAILPGDAIVLSGDIGRHGVAVMAAREGLAFETDVQSDCAPLNDMVEALHTESIPVHCLRDLTRGGLATALVELSRSRGLGIEIQETEILVSDGVQAACELLGLDPLFVANEGRCIAIAPSEIAAQIVAVFKRFETGRDARVIGRVLALSETSEACVLTPVGTRRLLSLFSGEQLPRIC